MKSAHRQQLPATAASPMKESADELLRRVSRLEERLAQLEKNGVADRSGSGPPADVRNAERESGRQVVEDRDSAAAGTETGGHPVSSRSADRKPAFGGTSAVKTEQLLQNHNPDFFREVCRKWNEVLGQVKERKITVYAWLVDGEPAAAGDAFVLVAFKNAIHRQTTDKPANKQLIEQVLEGVFDRSLTLHTVMRKDWEEMQAAAQGDPGRREEAEPLQLEPESPEPEEEKYKQDWIKEAVEWFGEDLVTVKTEETHSHTRKEEGP